MGAARRLCQLRSSSCRAPRRPQACASSVWASGCGLQARANAERLKIVIFYFFISLIDIERCHSLDMRTLAVTIIQLLVAVSSSTKLLFLDSTHIEDGGLRGGAHLSVTKPEKVSYR